MDAGAFDTHYEEGMIPWRTKKLQPALTVQSSTIVKAVVREPTN